MARYIELDALVAEIEKRAIEAGLHDGVIAETREDECYSILSIINTLEVKEVGNIPNIKFPHYKSIVEKVFGAGNLESFEYKEAEQLVSLAKEELLKDLEVKEMDLELITGWFDHIAQIADDRMTLTNQRMTDAHALDEIKCLAKNSSEFITRHYKAQKGEKV